MKDQLVVLEGKYNPNYMSFDLSTVPSINKPSRAFWSSSINERGSSDWVDWSVENNFYDNDRDYYFYRFIADGFKVFNLGDLESLELLKRKYTNGIYIHLIDFKALALDGYDGFRVEAIPYGFYGYPSVCSYDTESTVWFNDKFAKTLELVAVMRIKNFVDLQRRLAMQMVGC